MHLDELTDQMEDIYSQLESAGGVLTDELVAQIDVCEKGIAGVAGACCQQIKNKEAEVQAVKAEIERLGKRKKTIENEANGLKGYLQNQMQRLNTKKLDAGIFKITRKMNGQPSLVIDDNGLVPLKFSISTLKMPTERAMVGDLHQYITTQLFDKAALAAALSHDSDGKIGGCHFERGEHLLIK